MNAATQPPARRGTVVRRLAARALLKLALAVCDTQDRRAIGLPEHAETATRTPAAPVTEPPELSGRPTLRLISGGAR